MATANLRVAQYRALRMKICPPAKFEEVGGAPSNSS